MKSINWRSCVAAVLVMATGPAMAKDAILVQPAQFDVLAMLHSPPADASEQTKSELAELHQIQATRTQAEFDKAATDGKDETVFLFHALFGDGFTAERLPVTAAFFKKVGNDESVYATIAKNEWHRPRPFLVDADIHPCGPGKSFSYPSGHATRGYVLGVVLAAAVPEKRDAILERSADYARSRLICGVHYRTDVEAGRQVGTALAAVMLSMPPIQQQVADVRAELKAAGYITAP